MHSEQEIPVILVSDATGETAERVARSTLALFPDFKFRMVTHPRIRSLQELEGILAAHPEPAAIFFYTFVQKEMRERFRELLSRENRKGIDLLGSVLLELQEFLGKEPEAIPGSQHRWSSEYEARMSAIEFTVKHDDGLGINTIAEADIILLGPSRTGKTPLSMFLAMQGYRVANLPLVNGEPVPPLERSLTHPVLVGLTISAERLYHFREERIRRMKAHAAKSLYADPKAIETELELARRYFESQGIPVIDVTNKAVEEVAVEVLLHYRARKLKDLEKQSS